MRKVFISVLGTGFYQPCMYSDNNGFLSTETRFIQRAMVENLGIDKWQEPDVAYILLTEKAKTLNWEIPDAKRKNNKTQQMEDYTDLKSLIGQLPVVKTLDIPEGKDENEMWEIFSIVYEQLEEGDELYFDVTHSFRYLPMLLLVLINYAKYLKHVKVKEISYGNYENMDKEKKIAPIVDLLPLSVLQDWTFAAANFTENGDVGRLEELSKDELGPLQRHMYETNDKSNKKDDITNLSKFTKSARSFINELIFCRGIAIYEANSLKQMRDYASKCKNALIKPYQPVIGKIVESTNEFKVEEKNIWNNFAAARWCCKKGYYQPAITELQEAIVTFFCLRHGIVIDDGKQRAAVNKAFKKRSEPDTTLIYKDDKERILIDEIMKDENMTDDLVKKFADLTELRNSFNHSGMQKKQYKPDKMKKKISEHIESVIAELFP